MLAPVHTFAPTGQMGSKGCSNPGGKKSSTFFEHAVNAKLFVYRSIQLPETLPQTKGVHTYAHLPMHVWMQPRVMNNWKTAIKGAVHIRVKDGCENRENAQGLPAGEC